MPKNLSKYYQTVWISHLPSIFGKLSSFKKCTSKVPTPFFLDRSDTKLGSNKATVNS